MPKTREYDFQLFNVRLPAGTVERIQRYRDYLNQTQPGIEASASTPRACCSSVRSSRSRRRWASARDQPRMPVENSAARSKSRVPKSRVGDESSAHDKRFEGIGWLVSSAAIRRRRPR